MSILIIRALLLKQNPNYKNNQGFTLIELMVVVIIIGVLAAVALPNLLSQVGKAREVEAVTRIREYITAQSLYQTQEQNFAEDLDDLTINSNGTNYTYEMKNDGNESRIVAIPKNETLRALAGGVAIAPNQSFVSGICKANRTGKEFAVISEVFFNMGSKQVNCGKGLRKV